MLVSADKRALVILEPPVLVSWSTLHLTTTDTSIFEGFVCEYRHFHTDIVQRWIHKVTEQRTVSPISRSGKHEPEQTTHEHFGPVRLFPQNTEAQSSC